MNKKIAFTLLACLLVTGALTLSVYTSKASSSDNSQIILSSRSGNVSDSGEINTIFGSTLFSTSLDAIASESDYCVIGKVDSKLPKSNNLSRNPNNPSEESTDSKTMSKQFQIKVLKTLSGKIDEKNIIIEYPDYTFTGGKRFDEGRIDLETGKSFILFLKQNKRLGTYYGGCEPWAFEIDQNAIKVKTNLSGAEKYTAEIEKQINKKYISSIMHLEP